MKKKEKKKLSLPTVKKYILNGNVSSDALYRKGFLNQKIEGSNSYRLFIYHLLTDDILLGLEIILDGETYLFEDAENVYIIDSNTCELYYPFYMSNEYSLKLEQVINSYNLFMDSLVEDKILIAEKQKVLKTHNLY